MSIKANALNKVIVNALARMAGVSEEDAQAKLRNIHQAALGRCGIVAHTGPGTARATEYGAQRSAGTERLIAPRDAAGNMEPIMRLAVLSRACDTWHTTVDADAVLPLPAWATAEIRNIASSMKPRATPAGAVAGEMVADRVDALVNA